MSRGKQARGEGERPLAVRVLEPVLWPQLEHLFGVRGACGGCWCMHWRMQRGARWEEEKGARNQRAFAELVSAGEVHGCLAFAEDEPVGWCCAGPRRDFARLLRSRVLASDSGDDAWAVVCFFIPARWRGSGVASALLGGVVALARSRGARVIEGYPVATRGDPSVPYPAAFAFTGVPRLFERAGFADETPPRATRPIWRKRLRASRKRP